MSTITLPNTFTAGTTIQSSQVNSNFTTIYNDYNGNITNANVASGAAILASKLSLATIAQVVAMSGQALNFALGGALASASTVNIGAATGNSLHITGVVTITAFDTIQAGTIRTLIFDGILTLTHNGTSLILPTAANITTAAGDTATMMSEGSGNWRCIAYNTKSGSPLVAATASTALSGSVIQMVNLLVTANTSCATDIPLDNSARTSAEGNQIMTKAITPNNSSNLLRIDVVAYLGTASSANTAIILMNGTTVLATGRATTVTINPSCIALTHWMTAGTVSAITFNVNGGADGPTATLNASNASSLDAGKVTSSITITEIKA